MRLMSLFGALALATSLLACAHAPVGHQVPIEAQDQVNQGLAAFEQGDLARAEQAYRQAVSLDSECLEGHLGLGATLSSQGRDEEAVAAFRKAVALDARNARAQLGLAVALTGQENLGEAEKAFETAISLDPNNANAFYGLGTLCATTGNKPCLDRCLKALDDLNPHLAALLRTPL